MAILSSASQTYNPVVRAELTFQQRSSAAQRPRRWWRRILAWPYRLLVALAVVSSIVLISAEFTATLIGYDFAWLPQTVQNIAAIFLFFIPVVVLIPITILIHFRTQLRTLTFAANSISREKRGGTWDLLLLTPVDARQIVRGKWWATLCHVWRSYALLALLRAGATLWVIFEANRISISMYPTYHVEINTHYFEPSALHIALGVLAIGGYTMLNAVYTTAFGTLGSVFNRGGGTSLTLAIVIRTLTLIGIALVTGITAHLLFLRMLIGYNNYDFYYFSWPGHLYRLLGMAATTVFDNGFVVSGTLMIPNRSNDPFYVSYINGVAAGGLAALVVGVLLAWLSLLVAAWFVRRQGALIPQCAWWMGMKKKKLVDNAE